MINRDAPVGALETYPSYRHRFGNAALIYASSQLLIRSLRIAHNYPSRHSSPCSITYRHSWSVIQHGFHRRSPVGDRAQRLEPREKKTDMSRWSFAASS